MTLSIAVALAPACGSHVDLGEARAKIDPGATGGASATEHADAGGIVPVGTGGAPPAASGGRASGGGNPTSTGGVAPISFPEVSDIAFGPESSCNPISTTALDFNPCGRTSSLEFSRDGKLLIAATEEAPPNVHVYRLADGALLRDFTGVSGGSYQATLSPDGKQLAVCGVRADVFGDDATARVYDFETGEEQYSLPSHSGYYVGDVAFSADGALLATGGMRGAIEIWSAGSGALVARFDYPGSANHLQFAPSGSRLLVGGSDQRAIVWDFATQEVVFVIEPISYNSYFATLSPDGLLIGSTTPDNALQIHTAAAGTPVQLLSVFHQDFVSDVTWVSSNRLVTNDWSGLIASWKRNGSGLLAPEKAWITPGTADLRAEKAVSVGIAASPDGKTLAVGTAKGRTEGFVFLPL